MRRGWLPVLAALALGGAACGDDDTAADPAEFCVQLERLTENDPFAAFGDSASTEELRAGFDALVERADELADLAPDAARANAREYAEASGALRALMAAAAFDPAAIDVRAYREATITYNDAAQALEGYLDAEC